MKVCLSHSNILKQSEEDAAHRKWVFQNAYYWLVQIINTGHLETVSICIYNSMVMAVIAAATV